ncbi:MAG: hypothetical protein K6G48_04525 [Acholeplasmatales bacterium]|nr:hypothetical protein [Acholeplasmatales bacterium]
MNNIRRLYTSYTFNRANIIILMVSALLLFVLFNLYDFDISLFDYVEDITYFHDDYIRFSLNIASPISLVVLISIICIDYITNQKRFDLIFATRIKSKDLLKTKIYVYLLLSFLYMTIIWIMIMVIGIIRFKYFKLDQEMLQIYFMLNFIGAEAILMSMILQRATRIGFSAIIVFIIYFISRIVSDINKYIGNVLFLNINPFSKISALGLLPSFAIVLAYLTLLLAVFSKRELKIKK